MLRDSYQMLNARACTRRSPRYLTAMLAFLAQAAVTACSGNCSDIATVQVSMPAMVQRSGQTAGVRLFGETVDEPENPLRQFFLGDISQDKNGVGALWSMQPRGQGVGVLDWLTVQLQGSSFQAGEVVQAVAIPGDPIMGAWGYALAEGGGVQVLAPGFTTASASGTIQVLGVGPLRLRLDVLASDAKGETIAIQGDMSAGVGQTQSCLSQ